MIVDHFRGITLALMLGPAVIPGGALLAGSGTMQDTDTSRPANHLAGSLSPYLLQHAHNPVDWYPWGPEALARAEREDKPIFLSIGYAACHWCHVMEHECFEDAEVAGVLNAHFISIKVDREERPDLDEIYMQATLAMNQGQGGWPMSVFLTPQRVPFFAGTYYPKAQFLELTRSLAKAWAERRGEIHGVARQVQELLAEWAAGSAPAAGVPPADWRDRAAALVARHFDPQWGGLASGRNKFPPTMTLDLLMRAHAAGGGPELLKAVETTLDRMADGGIYDHLGGGICRYSTDPQWLVPHFEKMLYDQALVASVYLDGYQVFGKARYAEVAADIFDFVIRDLQSPEGGFYSSLDADSEGQEGKYYIWTLEEITRLLGGDAELFCEYYGVTAQGNWHEPHGHAPPGPKNILHVARSLESVAVAHQLRPDVLRSRLVTMRDTLLQARRRRVPPGLDDKILTEWNGLMIASLAKGARVLGQPRYAAAAARAADFVHQRLSRDGRLLRTYRAGQSTSGAFMTDYAFFIEGLLNLYEATFDPQWLVRAGQWADVCHQFFHDESAGGYYLTASDAEALITRGKSPRDGAIPSGNSVHAANLVRLAVLTHRPDLRTRAESIFRAFGQDVQENLLAFDRMLCALDLYYGPVREIALVGPRLEDLDPLLKVVYGGYLPNKVVAARAESGPGAQIPLLRNKAAVGGRATAYVCENYVCKSPVQQPADLRKLLWKE